MTTRCPKCQSENPDTAKFCSECASPLTSESGKPSFTKTLETPVSDLTRGTLFAERYEIIEELGSGGMGKVYRVEDRKANEEVALKLIRPEVAADKRTIDRFRNELTTARRIRHKNVCGMYDLGEYEGAHFITMEYVTGEDLKSLIRRVRIDIGASIKIAQQVCDGLEAAHSLGVVHRDLKPSNVMIDKEGNARIMDFGIARSVATKGITDRGVIIGTPEYLSPEQAETKEIDHRSDIYSLGVILYEMVTGQVPFEGDTPLSIVRKHADENPRNPKKINPQIPADLSLLILKCLEKDKEKRYQSAGEVQTELENIEKGLPITEMGVPKRKPLTSKEITLTLGLKKLMIPALIIIAVVVLAVIIWRFFPKKETATLISNNPSIAVLPFVDLSPQEDQAYFCDGLADELINRLTRIESLRVPARTSSFSFKGKELDIQEIGEKLDVDNVLEGSIRRSGDRLRITIQLVKVDDGYPIWSERYERDMEDVFSLQDEISLAIVDNLKIELLGEEKTEFVKSHTQNLEAYDLYLKGLFFWNKRTEESMKKAAEHFQQAIEIDPSYALAYAGLAYSYITLGAWGFLPAKEAYPKAREAAEKALKIDELLSEAHNALGSINLDYDWDWVLAEKEYQRAIELNPRNAQAHQWYSEFLNRMGRLDEALRENEIARQLDPLSLIINSYYAVLLDYQDEYDKAIAQINKILEMDPNFRPAHSYLASVYISKGMYEEALRELEMIDAVGWHHLIIYTKTGKKAKIQRVLDELKRQPRKPNANIRIAQLHFFLRERDHGFAYLEKAYEERERDLTFLKIFRFIDDEVRSDPRFITLLKKMNLE